MRPSEIAVLYNIEDLVRQTGFKIGGSGAGKWCICPFPNHTHGTNPSPSLSIFYHMGKQRFKCHGNCGAKGDAVDFIGYMKIPAYHPSDGNARKLAADLLCGGKYDINPPIIDARKEKKILHQSSAEEFLPINKDVLEYLNRRGISTKTAEKYKLGSATKLEENHAVKTDKDGILSIPTFMNGFLYGVKLRKISGAGKYRYFGVGGSKPAIFNYDEVTNSTNPVIVAKSELCCLTMLEAGFHACGLTVGEGAGTAKPYILLMQQAVVFSSKVIIVGDNDDAGIRAAEFRAKELSGIVKMPPPEFKDWDEWWLIDKENCERATREWTA